MWVWSLGQEDPLEKGMATRYSILAWKIPWTGEPGGLQSMGSQRVRHNWAANSFTSFFKHIKKKNYWRLITLQYCSGFAIYHMNRPWVYVCPPSWTPLPPPSPSHPSGLSQGTDFECPVSCIKLGLVIYFTYGNIHVSMLFSQIIPSSPSPTESKSLFFISVSLLLSHI